MRRQLKRLWKKHPALVLGISCSTIILILLLLGQQFETKALTLEIQWLALSSVPLILALFVGGYVQTFKGFGVELEARLETPVSALSLSATASDAVTELRPSQKGNFRHLQQIREQKIDRLIFVERRRNYYGFAAVKQYLEMLGQLQYVEVQSPENEFVCLLPIKIFTYAEPRSSNEPREVYDEIVERFIRNLERGRTLAEFGQSAITFSLIETESLVNALQKMRDHGVKKAAVVSQNLQFKGLLEVQKVEKRIADEVLNSSKLGKP